MPAAFSVENKRCVSFFNVGEKPTRDSEMNVSRDSESMKTIHSFISQKVDHNWSSSADLWRKAKNVDQLKVSTEMYFCRKKSFSCFCHFGLICHKSVLDK